MNGRILFLTRFPREPPIRKTTLRNKMTLHNQNKSISELLLGIAIISGLMVPFVRDLGASYSFATDWEINRFAFSTSNGRFASLFNLI